MQQIKKMGSLGNLMGMMPGVPKELKNANIDDDDLKPIEAIIRAMTPEERAQPVIINGSRRQRTANGSGTRVGDFNRLVKQFGEMQKMMKKMGMGGGPGGGGRPGKGKKGKKGRKTAGAKGRGLPPGLLDPNAPGTSVPGLPGMPNMPGLPGLPNR
jgi:signal recognition particle subunit SRP54